MRNVKRRDACHRRPDENTIPVIQTEMASSPEATDAGHKFDGHRTQLVPNLLDTLLNIIVHALTSVFRVG